MGCREGFFDQNVPSLHLNVSKCHRQREPGLLYKSVPSYDHTSGPSSRCDLPGFQPVNTRAAWNDRDLAELLIWAGREPVGANAVNAIRRIGSLH